MKIIHHHHHHHHGISSSPITLRTYWYVQRRALQCYRSLRAKN